MTERPILFSGAMVEAILAGRKTQTRRIVKPTPDWETPEPLSSTTSEGWQGPPDRSLWSECADPEMEVRRCPYGGPGDRLWVKETWRPRAAQHDWDLNVHYSADGAVRTIKDGEFGDNDWTMPKAAATGNVSPLFMPRWASRLTLEITDIRVERLREISREDAIAEGATSRPRIDGVVRHDGWSMDWSSVGTPGHSGQPLQERDICLADPQSAFANFINRLHGGARWNHYYNGDSRYPQPIFDANPWVWVVTFARLKL